MRTIVSDPPPAEFEALLERRRQWGADRHDEIWEGVYRMIPAPGEAHWLIDFRVPDRGLHRPQITGDWRPTAALVVEILSPGEETWAKLPFYAARDIDELLIVDPHSRTVKWLALGRDEYRPIKQSRLIPLGPTELAEQLEWPVVGSRQDK